MKIEEFKNKVMKEFEYTEMTIDNISDELSNEKDIESLYEKIKFLSQLGFSGYEVETIVEENPLFLTSDLETIKRAVNFLKNINVTDVVNTVLMSPEILVCSDKIMSENFKLLKVLISEKDLIKALEYDSEILTFNTDYLEKRLELFINNGLKDSILDIIKFEIEAFEDDESEIDIKILKARYLKD